MEFYTRNKQPQTKPTPAGEKEEQEYTIKINAKTGAKELIENGKTNIYEKIQAMKDSCDIYKIIERYNNGDIEAYEKLTRNNGIYGDLSNMPKNPAEAEQRLIDGEKIFKKLPLEVRREFNHNFTEFLNSIGNNTINEKFEKAQKRLLEAQNAKKGIGTQEIQKQAQEVTNNE